MLVFKCHCNYRQSTFQHLTFLPVERNVRDEQLQHSTRWCGGQGRVTCQGRKGRIAVTGRWGDGWHGSSSVCWWGGTGSFVYLCMLSSHHPHMGLWLSRGARSGLREVFQSGARAARRVGFRHACAAARGRGEQSSPETHPSQRLLKKVGMGAYTLAFVVCFSSGTYVSSSPYPLVPPLPRWRSG